MMLRWLLSARGADGDDPVSEKVADSVVGKEPARCVSTRVDHQLRNSYVAECRGSLRIPLRRSRRER